MKSMNNTWSNKKVAVLGMGVEGMASTLFLAKKGANVTILDKKNESEFEKTEIEQLKTLGIQVQFGESYLSDLEQFDSIVRSPGIPLFTNELQDAKKKGVEITSHIKIFFDACPSKIIGVTGTKGKGTTSSLIFEMLKKQGLDVYLGGNIGTPPLNFLDILTTDSVVVLELSSFQLEDLKKSPHIAVVLMVTSEHLAADQWGTQNYHKSLEDYVDAKRNIVRHQTFHDFAILNRDYPASNESDIHTKAKLFQVSREREAYDDGCFVRDESIIVRNNGTEEVVIPVAEILLPGKHNLENITAAVMAAKLAGVSVEVMYNVLKTFKGLQHRLELVGEVLGVRYYDDSFSTTPETAIAAIEAFKNPEIVILGGSSKKSDFTELGTVINNAKNIKAIIGIGVEWKRIKEHISTDRATFEVIEGLQTMAEIVKTASEIAGEGDVVILSPACASFDMFKNYKERGNQFKKEVERLSS